MKILNGKKVANRILEDREKYLLLRDRRDPLNPVYWVLVGQSLAQKNIWSRLNKKDILLILFCIK